MTLDVPSDYQDILRDAVASGAFASTEDALRHALDLFAAEQPTVCGHVGVVKESAKWNERNRLSIEQSEQGMSKPLNDDEVVARLMTRYRENENRL